MKKHLSLILTLFYLFTAIGLSIYIGYQPKQETTTDTPSKKAIALLD